MTAHRLLAKIFYPPYRDLIWRVPGDTNIYLTFDDGPYPPVTKRILSLLKKQKVPGTFFLSGEKIFAHRRELKKLSYKGHSVGNHFFHHIPPFGINAKTMMQEINLTDRLIQKHFKQSPQLFRPPYGIFSPALLKTLQKQNKRMILWSLMANDFKWSADRVLDHLRNSIRTGDVVVFHDSEKAGEIVLEVLPEFIKHCRERGFGFADIAGSVLAMRSGISTPWLLSTKTGLSP